MEGGGGGFITFGKLRYMYTRNLEDDIYRRACNAHCNIVNHGNIDTCLRHVALLHLMSGTTSWPKIYWYTALQACNYNSDQQKNIHIDKRKVVFTHLQVHYLFVTKTVLFAIVVLQVERVLATYPFVLDVRPDIN